MSAPRPLYIDSDQILFLQNVKDKEGLVLNDGSVTYEIVAKTPVEGEYTLVDSGTLLHVSEGRYEKVLDKTAIGEIIEGRRYYVKIVFTNPGGKDLTKRFEVYGAYSE